MNARRCCSVFSLLLFWLIGCDRDSFAPGDIEAASRTVSGSSLSAPSGTNATPLSFDQVGVSWQDHSTNETGFQLYRSTTGPDGPFSQRAVTGPNITGYSDTGLAPSTQYCYRVRAFRITGNKTIASEFSTAGCAVTLPPPLPTAPSFASASPAGSTLVQVQWLGWLYVDGFRVERSLDSATWTTAGTAGPTESSLYDGGRTADQWVCYRVVAFNTTGDSPPSNTACATPPAAPSDLTATITDSSTMEVDLHWTDHSTVEDGYEVWGDDGFGPIAFLPADATTYHACCSSFYFVLATKDGGYSDPSNTASPTAPASSSAPRMVRLERRHP
jgi:hypothetical protein